MENTSGQGKAASVPTEIDRWNWGAFLLSWIWGIGNNTYIALLMFVPFVNFVMWFALGLKGSAWAWRNKRWESVEHFQQVQRRWAKWGVGFLGAMVLLFVGVFFLASSSIRSTGAFQVAMSRVQADRRVLEHLGQPITAGTPMGNIRVSGPNGSAEFSFSVKGPQAEGTVFVEAVKDLGEWKVGRVIFQPDGEGERIAVAE